MSSCHINQSFADAGFRACDECACSIDPQRLHECEPERVEQWTLNLALAEIGRIESELTCYLATPQGAFHAFCAERDRLRAV